MPDEVLTIEEVAALKLAEKSAHAIAVARKIPALKIRGQWRTKRTQLDRWTDDQPRGGESAGWLFREHDVRSRATW